MSPQSGYRLNCSRRNGFAVRFSVKEKDEAGQTAWLLFGLRKDAFCLHSPFVVGMKVFFMSAAGLEHKQTIRRKKSGVFTDQ